MESCFWSIALLKNPVFPKVIWKFGSILESDVPGIKSDLGPEELSGITQGQVVQLWHIFHKSNEESQ